MGKTRYSTLKTLHFETIYPLILIIKDFIEMHENSMIYLGQEND